MDCQKNEKYLAALIDGEVSWLRKVMIKMHLKRCDYCQKMSELQAQVKKLLQKRVPHSNAPEGLKNKIHESLEKEVSH